MRPAVGQKIKITHVSGQSNVKPGDIVEVGPDAMAPPADRNGFIWLQCPKYPFADCKWGWVKWEPVGDDPVVAALKAARVYNDSEPVENSVRRLVAERDSERARADRLASSALANMGEAHQREKRIAALEKEVLRLSAPAGAAFTWQGTDKPPQCSETLAKPPVWVSTEDRARERLTRQRRELKRLNQRCRVLGLELATARHANEDLATLLMSYRRENRTLKALSDDT